MKIIKKLMITSWLVTVSIFAMQTAIMAASHDQDNPTKLQLNTEYESNAGYGDEWETKLNVGNEAIYNEMFEITVSGNSTKTCEFSYITSAGPGSADHYFEE